MNRGKIGIIFLLIMGVAFLSYAATTTSNVAVGNKGGGSTKAWVKTADVKGTSDKIDRGVRRLLLGWTEIPKSIVSTTKESRNPLWGITGGALKGIGKAFPKTVSGAADLIGVPIVNPTKTPISPAPIGVEKVAASTK